MEEIEKDTYSRLIESAGTLFAQKGFKETTIREICEHADANIASVNYYFRDKKKLFIQVLLFVIEKSEEKFPVDKMYEEFITPKDKLHEFIHDMVMRRFSPDLPDWFGKLINRETIMEIAEVRNLMMREHTKVRSFFRPFLASELKLDKDSMTVKLCETSILGNIRFLTGPIFFENHPLFGKEISEELLAKLIDYITDFSMASITGIRDKLQQEGNEKYEI